MMPRIVTHEEWLKAHQAHLAKEKAFTRQRDELARERRALPWERVEKDYVFEAPEGRVTLADLFAGRGQLLVQHFMFGPDWNEGCPSCSFWSDNFNGVDTHLAHRDTSFVLVSRAPIAKLEAYRKRMGWTFRWVSSAGSDFNFDYHVSFPEGTREQGVFHNFEQRPDPGIDELPGASVFYKDGDGTIYHTYSTYGRGGEMFLTVYGWLDIVPKGRNETKRGNLMDWVQRHDRYEDDGRTSPTSPMQQTVAE